MKKNKEDYVLKRAAEIEAEMKSKSGIQMSEREKETLHLKDQIRSNLGNLNKLNPVADVESFDTFNIHNIQAAVNGIARAMNLPITVTRPGFGDVVFTKKRVNRGFDYLPKARNEEYRTRLGQAYATAFLAAPSVVEKGVEIQEHINHKNYGHSTKTFAAPVNIDGKRGILAVVVKQTTENFYDVHSIMTPDGELLVLNRPKKQRPLQGATSRMKLSILPCSLLMTMYHRTPLKTRGNSRNATDMN